jgi:uncharacterized protein
MQDFFISIYTYANKKKIFSAIFFAIIAIILGFFATRIQFSEDITRLIPSNDKTNTTAKVLNQLNFADKITIKISTQKEGNADDLTEAATLFLSDLDTKCKGYVGKVQGKLDEKNLQETFDFVYDNLPLFLDQNDYKIIQNKIQNDSIAKIVAGNYKSLISPTGIVSRDFVLKDPLGISFVALKKMQQLSIGDDFELQDGFIITKNKQNLLLFITPKLPTNETDKNTIFVKQLNEIKKAINSKFKNKASLSFYGATPVAVGNATQIKSDVQLTSIFAGAALIFILAFFYRNITTPIIIFIPSLFGALFALAILYFVKGNISAISLGISSILLGETTDYSIYVLTHLRNNKNIKLLYKDISKPLLMCGVTTAISFLCLFFVKSEALKDLGIFAALSVFTTSFFSLVLIPLLYRFKNDNTISFNKNKNILDKLASYSYHKNKFLVASMFLLLIVCFFTYSKVTFNNDLASLNFVSPEMKQTEKELENITDGNSKSIYLATYGNDYETVLKNNNALFNTLKESKKNTEIVNYSSIGGIVFSEKVQKEKIAAWNTFWDNAKKEIVKKRLIANGNTFGFKANSFSQFYDRLDQKYTPISITDYQKIKSFFIDEFVAQKNGFYTISTLVKVSKEKRDDFVEQIKKQPNLVVVDRQQTNETFLGTLKENFTRLIDYSFIAIFFILLLSFRRIELVIVSIIPIMISWVFTTGLMGIFDLQFNVINIIVCTLIFGIGVDYSIFMTSALQKEHTYGKIELPTYRTSIMLSVATTILGIGVLIFAKHPALKSISIIAIIGIFSALLITFIIQPLVFNFIVTNRVKKGKAPFQFRTFIHGVLSFLYYGLGGLLMSLYSMTILKIIPLKVETKMRSYRYVISKFMKSVLYTNPFVDKKVINIPNEKFDKPAVIIANHTSFLDILAVGMLSSRIIYVVNDWVYNSPIFGGAVRNAGFYPASSGIEGGVEHLREKIEQGYSIVIFPEGTRSETNQIKRFHKGAFYLAAHFNLDIIPVIIHGNSELLPKGDFIIYDGKLTLNILDRIKPTDKSYGENYTERTKKTGAFFRTEFDKMRVSIEDPLYFKKLLLNSFTYKEIYIVEAVKKDFDLNAKRYHKLNPFIPAKAKIFHIADDYGQLDVLLALQEPQRKIDSYIIDSEKRSIAKTNYFTKIRNINYIEGIEIGLQNKYDVILLSDENLEIILEEILKISESIILIGDLKLKNSLINFGFKVTFEEHKIIVLNKK